MPKASNVVPLRKLPKTSAQAEMLRQLMRRDDPIIVSITVARDRDRFREQRAWRLLFGLYQDCACVPWSKGFKKMPDVPFRGRMRPSRLSLFLREAMPLVNQGRVVLRIKGERLRPRLLDVLAA